MRSRTTRFRHLAAAGIAAAAVATLAACGSTTGGSPESASRTATGGGQDGTRSQPTGDIPATAGPTPTVEATTAEPVDTSAASAQPSSSPSVAPAGSGALTGVPAVTSNAEDLTKEPVIAAGKGAASDQLVIRDLVVGTGDPATSTADTVDVKYVGTVYATGTVFDASWTRASSQTGVPDGESEFSLAQVVPGFAQGILGMKVGGRREIVIPPALGYGPSGGNAQAGISATDSIVFIVDLEKVAS